MSRLDSTGVIAALQPEFATARPVRRAGWLVVRSGIGAKAAREACLSLLDAGCERLLVWGAAGGLVPALRPGALLLPPAVIAADGARYDTDAAWCARLLARLSAHMPVVRQDLATLAAPLATRAEKEACAARTGAAAVDMEAGAVAALAAERGIAYAVVRAVADPLEMEIPRAALDAAGSRMPAPALGVSLLARPTDAAGVLQLWLAYRHTRRTLQRAARAIAAARC